MPLRRSVWGEQLGLGGELIVGSIPTKVGSDATFVGMLPTFSS